MTVLYRFEGLPSCSTENYEKTIFTAVLQRFYATKAFQQ